MGKIVKYGGMRNDRSSDKKSHKVRFEQALFKQIGPQLLYGLPVLRLDLGVPFCQRFAIHSVKCLRDFSSTRNQLSCHTFSQCTYTSAF